MTDLDRLDVLAAAATPGPWEFGENDGWDTGPGWHVWTKGDFDNEEQIFVAFTGNTRLSSDKADAAFIAACDPATIRSLVAAVRERDELRERPVDVEMIAASLMDPLVGPIVAALLAKHGITLALHREDGA